MDAWQIVREAGALGLAFVVLAALYREFHRVVAQRDRLFELLLKVVQSGNKHAETTEDLLEITKDKLL